MLDGVRDYRVQGLGAQGSGLGSCRMACWAVAVPDACGSGCCCHSVRDSRCNGWNLPAFESESQTLNPKPYTLNRTVNYPVILNLRFKGCSPQWSHEPWPAMF